MATGPRAVSPDDYTSSHADRTPQIDGERRAWAGSAPPILRQAEKRIAARKVVHGAFVLVLVSLVTVAIVVYFAIWPPEAPAEAGEFPPLLEVPLDWVLPDFLKEPALEFLVHWPKTADVVGIVLAIMFYLRRFLRQKTASIFERACQYLRT